MLDQGGAPQGKASSLLRMAQPHAGPGYGHHFPLRDGVEVLLTFIDGDSDRPIIAAAVPNPQTPSTVSGNNGVHNVLRTGGGTSLDIDDTEGSTAVTLATPFASTSLTMGASAAGIFLSTGQRALLETGQSITLLGGTSVEIVAKSTTVDVNAAIAINEKDAEDHRDRVGEHQRASPDHQRRRARKLERERSLDRRERRRERSGKVRRTSRSTRATRSRPSRAGKRGSRRLPRFSSCRTGCS